MKLSIEMGRYKKDLNTAATIQSFWADGEPLQAALYDLANSMQVTRDYIERTCGYINTAHWVDSLSLVNIATNEIGRGDYLMLMIEVKLKAIEYHRENWDYKEAGYGQRLDLLEDELLDLETELSELAWRANDENKNS